MQKVPQWYGETIGFWDGTTLVTWTANVQGWTLTHSMFEFSDKMETVETFKPTTDAAGKFTGISHETIFYDPDAFVAPVRATMLIRQVATPDDPERRYTFVECLSNIDNTNGRPGQLPRQTRASSTTTAGPGPRTGRSISKPGGTSPKRSCPKRSPTSSASK